jgi:hypothetical protein
MEDLYGKIILKWIFKKCDCGSMDLIDVAQNRNRCQAVVNAVMNLRGSVKCREFLA